MLGIVSRTGAAWFSSLFVEVLKCLAVFCVCVISFYSARVSLRDRTSTERADRIIGRIILEQLISQSLSIAFGMLRAGDASCGRLLGDDDLDSCLRFVHLNSLSVEGVAEHDLEHYGPAVFGPLDTGHIVERAVVKLGAIALERHADPIRMVVERSCHVECREDHLD